MPAETSATTIAIPVDPRIDLVGVFRFLADRVVPGIEDAAPDQYLRSVRTPSGSAVIEVRMAPGGLETTLHGAPPAAEPALLAAVRRLMALDAPIDEPDAVLAAHPLVAPLVAARPGIRIPGTVDGSEVLVRAIVGQQISVVAARGHLGELAACGDELHSPVGPITRLFPTSQQLALGGSELLRGPASRRETLRSVTAALTTGELVVAPESDPAGLRRQLLTFRGIGPWTADYVAMRVLGEPDAFLPGDSAVRLGARRLGVAEPLADFVARFTPWRSSLMMHLWRAAAAPASPATLAR